MEEVRQARRLVEAHGRRWLSLMLLVPVPWAGRVWALPFLTALAPSERHSGEQGRRHKTLTDWGRQLVLQARRWLPDRPLILMADSGFAALELLAALARRPHAASFAGRTAARSTGPPRRSGTAAGAWRLSFPCNLCGGALPGQGKTSGLS
jgi:hypothetical protein